MSEFPHYFGLDFSGALPWILMGFIAGVVLTLIWRWLKGSALNAKTEVRVNEIQALLSAEKIEHQANVARLLGDARNFETALADAERRAAVAGSNTSILSGEIERLKAAELATRNDLLAAISERDKVKASLHWAESQARNFDQERRAFEQLRVGLEQQARNTAGERQSFMADLATARTAAELKDSEIARLINQLQWHESRAAALESEKQSLASGLTAFKSGESTKDAEIARLRSELATAQTALGSLQSEAGSRAQALMSHQASTDQLRKDHDYMRNLAYWQASEVERLRGAITKFEAQVASNSKAYGLLQQQHATLKARIAARQGALGTKGLKGKQGAGKNRFGYFRRQGTNGTSADSHAHAKGAPLSLAAHLRRDAVKALLRTKGMRVIGRGGAQSAPRAQGDLLISLGTAHRTARRSDMGGSASAELAALKAKVAELSAEAANYRLLRQALDTANRIAGGNVG
jgi:hypothetical protein